MSIFRSLSNRLAPSPVLEQRPPQQDTNARAPQSPPPLPSFARLLSSDDLTLLQLQTRCQLGGLDDAERPTAWRILLNALPARPSARPSAAASNLRQYGVFLQDISHSLSQCTFSLLAECVSVDEAQYLVHDGDVLRELGSPHAGAGPAKLVATTDSTTAAATATAAAAAAAAAGSIVEAEIAAALATTTPDDGLRDDPNWGVDATLAPPPMLVLEEVTALRRAGGKEEGNPPRGECVDAETNSRAQQLPLFLSPTDASPSLGAVRAANTAASGVEPDGQQQRQPAVVHLQQMTDESPTFFSPVGSPPSIIARAAVPLSTSPPLASLAPSSPGPATAASPVMSDASSGHASKPTERSKTEEHDLHLLQQIDKDLERTNSDLAWFNSIPNLLAMRRVLLTFAKLNGGVGYVQGMNELLAPLWWVFARGIPEADSARRASAEADVFFAFMTLMSEVRDLFIVASDHSQSGVRATVGRFGAMLVRREPAVTAHFANIGLDPQMFAFRWITTLLSREFTLPDTVIIWDALLSDPSRLLHTSLLCTSVAMIRLVKAELLTLQFGKAVKMLQSYPPAQDVGAILRAAAAVRREEELDATAAGQVSPANRGASSGAPVRWVSAALQRSESARSVLASRLTSAASSALRSVAAIGAAATGPLSVSASTGDASSPRLRGVESAATSAAATRSTVELLHQQLLESSFSGGAPSPISTGPASPYTAAGAGGASSSSSGGGGGGGGAGVGAGAGAAASVFTPRSCGVTSPAGQALAASVAVGGSGAASRDPRADAQVAAGSANVAIPTVSEPFR